MVQFEECLLIPPSGCKIFSETMCPTPTLGFQEGLVLLLPLLTEKSGMDFLIIEKSKFYLNVNI